MTGRIEEAIAKAMRAEVEVIAREEADAAKERMEKRISALLPNIVMGVLRYYEVHADRGRIVIEVRDKLKEAE